MNRFSLFLLLLPWFPSWLPPPPSTFLPLSTTTDGPHSPLSSLPLDYPSLFSTQLFFFFPLFPFTPRRFSCSLYFINPPPPLCCSPVLLPSLASAPRHSLSFLPSSSPRGNPSPPSVWLWWIQRLSEQINLAKLMRLSKGINFMWPRVCLCELLSVCV